MTDLEIIIGLKEGNTVIMKDLYKYMPYIQKIAIKNSGSGQDGEDLFQETLIIFYKNIRKDDFQLTSTIKAYLYGIAYNLWLKHLRNSAKEKTAKTEMTEEAIKLVSDDSKTDFETNLRNAFLKLDEMCRNLLTSYYFHDLSMELISKKYNYKSEQVARQQKYRCMKKLKERLK